MLKHTWNFNKKRAVDICIDEVNHWLEGESVTDYFSPPDDSQKYVLISYSVSHYYDGFQFPKFYSTPRQSVWQGREIARAFHDLGYGVDIYSLNGAVEPEDYSKYDVLFGCEPNFERFARNLDADTTKIYYGAGMHWSQRNPAVREHVERLNERRDTEREPSRLLPETKAEELADALVVIGDEYTKSTYLDQVGDKPCYNIYTTTYDFLNCGTDERNFETARSNLLWFTGGDLVYKGLDITLDAVAKMDGVDLYVCGPLEADVEFAKIYEQELFETENIHPVGWVDVRSDKFQELTKQCGYMIHTGITEGFPGSIAHCMKRGLVPIITHEVASNVGEWGVQIPDHEIDTIRRTIEKAITIAPDELQKKSRQACERAREEHTREAYSTRFREILESALNEGFGEATGESPEQ